MRNAIILASAALALVACDRKPSDAPRAPAPPTAPPASSITPAALPNRMPERAPGLWEQKVSTNGMTQVSQVCIDKAVEQRFTVWGQQAGKHACSDTEIRARASGGWEFASTCDMGEGGVTATKGSITGDFARAYKVSAESTISGARAAQMNGAHAMTLEANWRGACPAGMTPGDMVLPGGMKINMMQIPTG